jgi:hypothetical protein
MLGQTGDGDTEGEGLADLGFVNRLGFVEGLRLRTVVRLWTGLLPLTRGAGIWPYGELVNEPITGRVVPCWANWANRVRERAKRVVLNCVGPGLPDGLVSEPKHGPCRALRQPGTTCQFRRI